MKIFKSIKTDFIFVVILTLVFILAMQTGFSLYEFDNTTKQEIKNKLIFQSENEANKANSEFLKIGKLNEASADFISSMKKYDTNLIFTTLRHYINSEPLIVGGGIWMEPYAYNTELKYFGPYFYKDKFRNIKLTWKYVTPQKIYFKYDWYKNGFIPGKTIVWSEPYPDAVTGVPMITVTSPIKKTAKVVGITTLDVGLKELKDYVKKIKVGHTGYAFIISKQGYYLGLKGKKCLIDKITEEKSSEIKNLGKKIIKANKTEISRIKLNGKNVFVVYTPIGATGMKMVSVLSVAELYSPFNKHLIINITSFLLAIILVSVILATIFSKKIADPLTAIIDNMKKVAGGNLNVEPIKVKTENEIGELSTAFNTMTCNLQNFEQREILLRDIVEKIRSSLDIDETLTFICDEVAKLFNVQRAAISELYDKNDLSKFIPRREYKENENIKGLFDIDYDDRTAKFIHETVLDKGDYLIISNMTESDLPDYFKKNYEDMGVKSALCLPIKKDEDKFGTIFLAEYDYYRQWTDEEIELAKLIVNQIYVAIKQAELYEKEKRIAEREVFLRRIAELIKNSNDIEEILFFICKELTEFLNAYGVKIHLLDIGNNTIKNLKSYSTNTEFIKTNFNDEVRDYILIKAKSTVLDIIPDTSNSNLNMELIKYLQSKNIKSIIWDSTHEANNLYYGLFVADNQVRIWTKYEIQLIQKVSEYVGKAIMGATLYSQSLFISNVLHELKNPLTAINTFSEAIINRDKEKSELTEKFMGKIKNNADRLISIIDNMLFVSAIGESKDYFRTTNLSETLKKSIEYVQDFADSKDIEIVLNYENEVIINTDEELLTQAFINIINNAIKYSPENSKIEINFKTIENEALISINDQGCGIDINHIKNIFEPFYRVDKSRNRASGGTGLGLYIVKSIIQKLGGRINCESILNEGTIFSIYMPAIK